MTRGGVIDASAALAFILGEEGRTSVARVLASWRRDGVVVRVPAHFWLEVANSMVRRRRLPSDIVIEAIHRLDEFGLETIDLDRPLILLALDLADRHGLSMYDAAYLALLDGPVELLTADHRLLDVAGTKAIPVPGGERRLSELPADYEVTPTWPRYSEVSAYLGMIRAETQRADAARSLR